MAARATSVERWRRHPESNWGMGDLQYTGKGRFFPLRTAPNRPGTSVRRGPFVGPGEEAGRSRGLPKHPVRGVLHLGIVAVRRSPKEGQLRPHHRRDGGAANNEGLILIQRKVDKLLRVHHGGVRTGRDRPGAERRLRLLLLNHV